MTRTTLQPLVKWTLKRGVVVFSSGPSTHPPNLYQPWGIISLFTDLNYIKPSTPLKRISLQPDSQHFSPSTPYVYWGTCASVTAPESSGVRLICPTSTPKRSHTMRMTSKMDKYLDSLGFAPRRCNTAYHATYINTVHCSSLHHKMCWNFLGY